jgi:hypothetical protein
MVILVRKSSGEVISISTDASPYSGVDPAYFITVTDPPRGNGDDLAVKKIWTGTIMRDARPGEIAAFATSETSDNLKQTRQRAIDDLQNDPVLRKTLMAFLSVMLGQINTLRGSCRTSNCHDESGSQRYHQCYQLGQFRLAF